MFERYTEKARRVIFFARYEASQFGAPAIETEHLLLGILREDKRLTSRLLRSQASVDSIRRQIEAATTQRERISTSVDLPISTEGKRVMAFAAEEAEKLGHSHIGTEHLLLGLLREEGCLAATLLNERGVRLESVHAELESRPAPPVAQTAAAAASGPPAGAFRDLTQAAAEGSLEPLVGRTQELETLAEILGQRTLRNPLLAGERGVGKTALVEGLAQRIAEGKVPAFLQGKKLLSIEPSVLSSWAAERPGFAGIARVLTAMAKPETSILFIDGRSGLLTVQRPGIPDVAAIVRFALELGLQCIAAGDPDELAAAREAIPWLGAWFRTLYLRPPDESSALEILGLRKTELEAFHGVCYSEGALAFAARWARSRVAKGSLPGRALELLDAAGSAVKMRHEAIPEIAETEKKVQFIAEREEEAVASHEFAKAQFYSEEGRKERANLDALRARHSQAEPAAQPVDQPDLEQVVARWAAYPYKP